LNLDTLEPTVSGPKRPQDKILVKDFAAQFSQLLEKEYNRNYLPVKERQEQAWLYEGGSGSEFTYETHPKDPVIEVKNENIRSVRIKIKNQEYVVSDGSIVIAAITSCTNTSNP